MPANLVEWTTYDRSFSTFHAKSASPIRTKLKRPKPPSIKVTTPVPQWSAHNPSSVPKVVKGRFVIQTSHISEKKKTREQNRAKRQDKNAVNHSKYPLFRTSPPILSFSFSSLTVCSLRLSPLRLSPPQNLSTLAPPVAAHLKHTLSMGALSFFLPQPSSPSHLFPSPNALLSSLLHYNI